MYIIYLILIYFTFKGSSYKGYCLVDNKLFVTKLTSTTPQEATKNVYSQVLAYFSYTPLLLEERVDGFVFSYVQRDFFNLHFTNRFSPLKKCPSQNMGWINKCFLNQEIMIDGVQINMQLLREKMGLLFSTG